MLSTANRGDVRNRYFYYAAVCILLLSALNVSSQIKSKLEKFSTKDGLSHDGVLGITKDSEGFMWFGTSDGVNRFDGQTFKTYKGRPGDSSNFKNNKIRNLIEDKSGYLWVTTFDHLVYRFDKKNEKFLSVLATNKGLESILVSRVIPVSTGDSWLLTANQGLICAVNVQSSPIPQLHHYSLEAGGDFKIPSNTINFLFEDTSGKSWIGTTNGLVCMVKSKTGYRKILFKNKQQVLAPGTSFTCAKENKGVIYFGTSNGSLASYNIKSGAFYEMMLSPGTNINSVNVSRAGLIYASTSGKGLIVVNLQNKNISQVSIPDGNTGYSIFEDRTGLIWVEPKNSGIIRYNPKNKTVKHFTQEKDANVLSPDKNYAAFEDINGILWLSLKGVGFGYYNAAADKVEYFHNRPGSEKQQFSNIITALYSDPAGILWLGTNDGGINKITFPDNSFNQKLLVENSKNKSENAVRALYEDKIGRLWLGTRAGRLYVFKDGKEETDILIDMPASDVGSVYSITETRDGTIWLGTKGRGLLMAKPVDRNRSRYKLTRFTSSASDKYSLSSDLVYSVIEDRRGRIWVGTLGGGLNLVVKTGDKISFRNSNNSFKHYPATANVIRYLQEGPAGKIWIATTDGLIIFNPDNGNPETYRFLKYSKIPGDRSSLGNNDVQFIYKDNAGQMWVGTLGGGLNKVISPPGDEKLRFQIFTQEEGLPNDIILSMVDDKQGSLWMATENGLSRFKFSDETFRNYDSYDGLPETGFSEATCFRSQTGDLYFGGINGYISFNPKNIVNRRLNANMAFTNLQLHNKDVIAGDPDSPLKFSLNSTDHVTLGYDQDIISIDYTILDHRASNKVSYAYILKGFDKDWHYVKNQRKATYTNLPPGDYEFVVKSINNDLFNNIPSKSIKFTILPPPWRTVWAYVIYFIVAVVLIEIARRIIFTMIRLRNKVVVEHKLTDLKLQFFTNISHELRTPLTLIVSPLEELSKTEQISARGRENLGIVTRNANRMIRLINQLLDFRKVQSGKMKLKVAKVDMVNLLREVSKYFTGAAFDKNIDLQVKSNVNELFVWIDEEKIDIIIYNLLSNAFKFSPRNKKIFIELTYVSGDADFTITVTDQGYGIPKNKLSQIFELYYEGDKVSENNSKGTGIGLALSKEFIQMHKGSISASNNPEGGTIFTINLKMGNAHFEKDELDLVNSDNTPLFNSDFINTESASAETAIGSNQLSDRQSVLLVEDNSELRKFLANQLSSFYKVKEAVDGIEGLKLAQETLPDLIISDVMMPNMDGIEMLDELKKNALTSHIPVILLTAKSSVESQIEGLRYGADFYITKPFHTDHIMASVSNLLVQRKNLFESLASHDKKLVQLKPDEILITSRDEQFLKDVIGIVEKGVEENDFNIDSVAGAVGLGRTTFYKKLKSLTGLAPVEFVRDMRLKRAKQLLDSGEYTISEIAYKTGFNSSGYFSTCFKEKYLLSPSDYLKKYNNELRHSQN